MNWQFIFVFVGINIAIVMVGVFFRYGYEKGKEVGEMKGWNDAFYHNWLKVKPPERWDFRGHPIERAKRGE